MDIRATLQGFNNIPSTLGMVKASDIQAAVAAALLQLDIDEATERCDFETVAALQNGTVQAV